MRFMLGPLCDQFGAKRMMCGLLVICTVPCVLSGTVNSLTSLAISRTLIGCIGGTFVPSQYWTSCHFNKNVVGSAMAFSAGWGGMGGGEKLIKILVKELISARVILLTYFLLNVTFGCLFLHL